MSDEIDQLPLAGYEINYPHRGVKLTTRIQGKTFVEGTDIHELIRKADLDKLIDQVWENKIIQPGKIQADKPSQAWIMGFQAALMSVKKAAGFEKKLGTDIPEEVDPEGE
ncbi:hypothetical protein SAMN05443574_103332 [Haloarcula vallismortis]|uniref:Tail assembly chaperone n=2 Tax=Haloarcula vallismortis TaxID=28442 RepID=M0JTA8_HALVA|nr:hypothetical protein [Haloarcula vallismortis]EMA11593.1 hypothetical protein C437_01735 [Haloarcula vallismortis ATCC 29715]SDW45765.1 hypothetical protein SAMN05443574_103332 [Haloarcula vallismortis]